MPKPHDNPASDDTQQAVPIIRHDQGPNQFKLAVTGESVEPISDHIETYIGKIDSVFHELVSDHVHIDVHWVKPTQKRPVHTLITTGMSDLPMTIPEGIDHPRHIELTLTLPSYWDFDTTTFNKPDEESEKWYWPVRLLKYLARFPHLYNTHLGLYHTLPNGDPPEPYDASTSLCCAMIMPSVLTSKKFHELQIDEEKTIHFYSVIALFEEEMNFKLSQGTQALVDKINQLGLKDIVYPQRNACIPLKKKKKRFGLF